ncbi:MAG: clan AA aspartic protease [Blastocatellales bacterium]
MINGFVNANLEAVIRLTVLDARGAERTIEAIIDTGYNGFLTLPSETIADLNLTHFGREPVQLANGHHEIFDLYLASVVWDGQPKTIVVDAAETEPLVGTALLDGCDLHVHFAIDGHVTIESFSSA